MADPVRVERDGAVGRLVFDRPDANNAMDAASADALHEGAVELATDDDVRCLVVTGVGGVFNTGADLTTLAGDERDEPAIKSLAATLHDFVDALARAPKPVVCGVNGVVAGGGIGTALVGDIVIMSTSARFQFAYPAIGLSADGGSSYFLPRLVGLRDAQRIALRNEPVGAKEAEELGLVTETVPDSEFDERLETEAETLAAGPTQAYAETKELLRTSFDHGLGEQLGREADRIAGLTATDDYERGYEAFFGSESASFSGE
ncbi:enoyl-CoA hydratase/isomerase family protein [Halosegnis longus]|uniref:Enoyl-CoA hydratase/isomerase family protein n=1 Tax=Halosegnis longus TaxID=2216012 RepID=A0AAJ4UWC6_9EURY|nr:enoyl-CoA hydratase-related protein [Halosegnis longus]RNJ26784.1 enoyl-CoA hydratase/isomerase family protein [Salella cibi]